MAHISKCHTTASSPTSFLFYGLPTCVYNSQNPKNDKGHREKKQVEMLVVVVVFICEMKRRRERARMMNELCDRKLYIQEFFGTYELLLSPKKSYTSSSLWLCRIALKFSKLVGIHTTNITLAGIIY